MALGADGWIWGNGEMIPTGEGKPKYWEEKKKQSQCHYVHNEYKTEWSGIEPGPPGAENGE